MASFETASAARTDAAPFGARTGWFLALFGAVPFWTMALLLTLAPEVAFVRFGGPTVLVTYGAVILSFLGGIRWGAAMAATASAKERASTMVLSTVPSLVGWFAVFLPTPPSLMLLAVAFALQGGWDVRDARRGFLPEWFGRLRLTLTLLVVAALLVASAAALF